MSVDRFDQDIELIPLTDMTRDRQRPPTERFYFFSSRLALLELAASNRDVGTVGGKSERHLPAKPAATAGN